MTAGQLVVIALRLVVPLLILKRPLAGGIVAMALDALDVVIVEWISVGGMGEHYHSLDKLLDLWYLSLEAWVAWTWTEHIPRITALILFGWRVIGTVLFELIGWRPLLFVFPNLFENWYLFVLICRRWFPNVHLRTWRSAFLWLAVLYIPKLGQEYLLHIAQASPWDWIKERFGR